MILSYLRDRATAIRVVAIEKIQDLAKSYGVNWLNSFIGKLYEVVAK